MQLTCHYIGDDWRQESFLPMKMCIRMLGIYNACWISRVITYLFIGTCVYYRRNYLMNTILFTVAVLYWTSMTMWLFTLDILSLPKLG